MKRLALFLREIRIEHTLFALPFAYVGAILAARGIPQPAAIGWITLAVLGARTAAMAANRYLDREIDARNPRTARRALASGTLAPSAMLWAAAAGIAVLFWAAWMLNPLCVKLMPIALLLLLTYPLCKRFTWTGHFVLGAVDGLAPLGAYIGVAGKVSLAALLLFAAVAIWVAGFDIIYALMDVGIDRDQGIGSLPSRFGEASGRVLPVVLHAVVLVLLAGAGILAAAGPIYFLGVLSVAALIIYEEHLLRSDVNLFVINERVFISNMTFSVVFLIATIGGYL
jgi:4-hydroxybenzoate polyprenyltransferase